MFPRLSSSGNKIFHPMDQYRSLNTACTITRIVSGTNGFGYLTGVSVEHGSEDTLRAVHALSRNGRKWQNLNCLKWDAFSDHEYETRFQNVFVVIINEERTIIFKSIGLIFFQFLDGTLHWTTSSLLWIFFCFQSWASHQRVYYSFSHVLSAFLTLSC